MYCWYQSNFKRRPARLAVRPQEPKAVACSKSICGCSLSALCQFSLSFHNKQTDFSRLNCGQSDPMRKGHMARRKLTNEERHFRRIGSGIPFSRWWPAIAIFVGVVIAVSNAQYVATCTGIPLGEYSGPRSARIAMLFAYPRSPYLLREGLYGWLTFLSLWGPWPFAILNWRWARRQRKFWDGERLREAKRPNGKRAAKAYDQDSPLSPPETAVIADLSPIH